MVEVPSSRGPPGPVRVDLEGDHAYLGRRRIGDQLMGALVAGLLVALFVVGFGFAVHVLWIVAIGLIAAWLVGIALRRLRRPSDAR